MSYTQSMEDFDFGLINPSIKKKHVNQTSDKIHLYSQNSGKTKHILFLVESPAIKKELLTSLSTWLRKEFPPAQYDFDIVSASTLTYNHEQIQNEGVCKFYKESRSEFLKFVRPNVTEILAFGYSLTGITLNSDIQVSDFYDIVFNESCFYSPYASATVYPVDELNRLFKKESGSYLLKDCSRMEFAKHQYHQIKTRFGFQNPCLNESRLQLCKISSPKEWEAFYGRFRGSEYPMVAWDTETSSLDYNKAELGYLTMSFDGVTGYFIPWKNVNVAQFCDLLKNKKQIFANAKYDLKVSQKHGVTTGKVYSDVVSLGKHLNEMRSNSLKSLAFYYTMHGGYDDELDAYKEKHKITNYLDIPEPIMFPYATMDAIMTFQVHEAMMRQLKALDKKYPPPSYGNTIGWTMERYYHDIRIPPINTFTKIEQRGICVNLKKWDENSNIVQGKITALKKEISQAFDMKVVSQFTTSLSDELDDELFDYDEIGMASEEETGDELKSGQKLGRILEAQKWECLGRSKAKYYLTGDEQLTRWEQLGHKEASLIKKLRSYLTMQKTFLGRVGTQEGWRQYVTYHKEDNTYRIHPSYGVMATESGRNSCSSPNWQQLPSSALDAHLFKEIFCTPDDDEWVMLTLDFKAFQVRLSALDVGDKRDYLFNAYLEDPDLDLHSKTGYNVFCKGEYYEFVELNGKEYYRDQEVTVLRNAEKMKIPAIDVRETDELAG